MFSKADAPGEDRELFTARNFKISLVSGQCNYVRRDGVGNGSESLKQVTLSGGCTLDTGTRSDCGIFISFCVRARSGASREDSQHSSAGLLNFTGAAAEDGFICPGNSICVIK